MGVKRNSLQGLDALINIASGTPTGGSTDDLGEGQVYVAKIIKEVPPTDPNNPHLIQRIGSLSPAPAKLYKIKIQEELGNSITGTELLLTEPEELKDVTSQGLSTVDVGNFVLNMLPEGIYMVESEQQEPPGIGDEVYATADGGIEGRYLLANKEGKQKTDQGGYGVYDPKTGTWSSPSQSFTDENGNPIAAEDRKNNLLSFVKEVMVPSAIRITSDYAKRTHPVTGDPAKHHYGVDVGVGGATGVKLYAPRKGKITVAKFQDEAGSYWANGNYIKLRHDDGNESVFLHLQTISDKIRPIDGTPEVITSPEQIPLNQKSAAPFSQRAGEQRSGGRPKLGVVTVEKGDLLGTIGTSGRSTGIHLHWQFSSQADPYAIVFGQWKTEPSV